MPFHDILQVWSGSSRYYRKRSVTFGRDLRKVMWN